MQRPSKQENKNTNSLKVTVLKKVADNLFILQSVRAIPGFILNVNTFLLTTADFNIITSNHLVMFSWKF